jgi:hypothetical protein
MRIAIKKSVFDPIQFQHPHPPNFGQLNIPSSIINSQLDSGWEAKSDSSRPSTAEKKENLKTTVSVFRFQVERIAAKTVSQLIPWESNGSGAAIPAR